MESRPRSKVEDLVSFSEFLALVAAAFVTVIEQSLQSLEYFLRVLELAVLSGRFVEGWGIRYIFQYVRDGAGSFRLIQQQRGVQSGQNGVRSGQKYHVRPSLSRVSED